jgi:hypothetical protein
MRFHFIRTASAEYRSLGGINEYIAPAGLARMSPPVSDNDCSCGAGAMAAKAIRRRLARIEVLLKACRISRQGSPGSGSGDREADGLIDAAPVRGHVLPRASGAG